MDSGSLFKFSLSKYRAINIQPDGTQTTYIVNENPLPTVPSKSDLGQLTTGTLDTSSNCIVGAAKGNEALHPKKRLFDAISPELVLALFKAYSSSNFKVHKVIEPHL